MSASSAGPGSSPGSMSSIVVAALADRGVAGHATVAFEDHPRAVVVDELAGLLRRHLGPAGPGRVLGEHERDQVGAVGGRGGAKHRRSSRQGAAPKSTSSVLTVPAVRPGAFW